ncbi:CPBP family intramembrane metalloprotease [Candidatus Micrarchaeota archaeon]|nr:CPBP family intramembrane metalloprotease [Candidatus Micrarchaeota archaeon]
MTATLLLYGLMVLLVIYGVRKEKGSWLERIGFRKTVLWKDTLISLGFFGILFGIAIILSIISYSIDSTDAAKASGIIRQLDVAEVIVTIVAAAFVEEIFFRGYLQARTNLVFASFVFGFFHIAFGSLTQVVGAFVLGAVLGIEYKITKSIYAPVLSHFLYDLAVVLLVFGLG